MEQIKLNISTDNKEVIIRTGEALKLKEPKIINIVGNIDSVSRFLTQRGTGTDNDTKVDTTKAVIILDREKLSIGISLDATNPYGGSISGSMQLNPDLAVFQINKDKKFAREDLLSLIKLNRFFFADKDAHALLLSKVKSFKANVSKELQADNDSRGNKTNVNNQTLTTDVPESFILKLPIFKGEKDSTFIVELCMDITDGGTRFWLESLDLNELIIKKRDEVFETEVKKFEGFLVIEQ